MSIYKIYHGSTKHTMKIYVLEGWQQENCENIDLCGVCSYKLHRIFKRFKNTMFNIKINICRICLKRFKWKHISPKKPIYWSYKLKFKFRVRYIQLKAKENNNKIVKVLDISQEGDEQTNKTDYTASKNPLLLEVQLINNLSDCK